MGFAYFLIYLYTENPLYEIHSIKKTQPNKIPKTDLRNDTRKAQKYIFFQNKQNFIDHSN